MGRPSLMRWSASTTPSLANVTNSPKVSAIEDTYRPDELPKVPEGCLGGFWHFWHLVILGFSEDKITRSTEEM